MWVVNGVRVELEIRVLGVVCYFAHISFQATNKYALKCMCVCVDNLLKFC